MNPIAVNSKRFALFSVLVAFFMGFISIAMLHYRGPIIWLPFAFALISAILHVASASMVWRGLASFKPEFQRAYRYICIGTIFVGLTQLQLPIISIFNWWSLRENGVIIIPFIVPFMFFLIGVRRFAKLLNISTSWVSAARVNSAGVLLGVIVAFVTRDIGSGDRLIFAGTMILLTWIAAHATALVVAVLQIKTRIGVHYVNAMAWLSITYMAVLATTLAYMVTLLVASPGDWYLDYNVSVAPFVLVGLLWVRAGYAFDAILVPGQSKNRLGPFFGPGLVKPGPYPSVDIVIFLAGQASDTTAIDPIMDDVRAITASAMPGGGITPEQQQKLATVFLKLEDYLIAKDPLRSRTKEEIRDEIELSFPGESLTKSFWPTLQGSSISGLRM